jgi:mannose-1-phosphate guanylyltransferase/mannose-6-phosphate isomerase
MSERRPSGDRRRPLCYAVIMAGGHGTRFWPRSRRRLPKQLLAIVGQRTLLQETARRLLPAFPWDRMLVVTSRDQGREVRRQLPGLPANHVLMEPMGRNTAPCVALAAEWIAVREPDAIMAVVPADHVIDSGTALRSALGAACGLASRIDALVTLGIKPTRAETGYGYIEVAQRIARHTPEMYWVRRFHEKPSAPVARRYLASGRHLWNSGMFVWRVSVFRQALRDHLPDLGRAFEGVWRSMPAAKRERRLARVYRRLPSVSVDVGIMQPLTAARHASLRVAVVPVRFAWSDVGSWIAMSEIWGRGRAGNTTIGRVLPVATKNSIVYSPERLVALVGVTDLIVVDSADAVLICARDRAQDVRKVTDELERRGWSTYL